MNTLYAQMKIVKNNCCAYVGFIITSRCHKKLITVYMKNIAKNIGEFGKNIVVMLVGIAVLAWALISVICCLL